MVSSRWALQSAFRRRRSASPHQQRCPCSKPSVVPRITRCGLIAWTDWTVVLIQFLTLGRIGSIELDRKPVDSAKRGQQVAIRITPTSFTQNQFQVGRQFDENDELVSKLTRESIDLLKEFHRDDMEKKDWLLVIKLKKQLGYAHAPAFLICFEPLKFRVAQLSRRRSQDHVITAWPCWRWFGDEWRSMF